VPGGQGCIIPVPGTVGDEVPPGVLLWGDWGTLPGGIRGWVGPGAPGNVPGWVVPGNPGVPGTPGVVVCADAVPVTKAPTRATAQAVFRVMGSVSFRKSERPHTIECIACATISQTLRPA
jgi:hypothetical protein